MIPVLLGPLGWCCRSAQGLSLSVQKHRCLHIRVQCTKSCLQHRYDHGLSNTTAHNTAHTRPRKVGSAHHRRERKETPWLWGERKQFALLPISWSSSEAFPSGFLFTEHRNYPSPAVTPAASDRMISSRFPFSDPCRSFRPTSCLPRSSAIPVNSIKSQQIKNLGPKHLRAKHFWHELLVSSDREWMLFHSLSTHFLISFSGIRMTLVYHSLSQQQTIFGQSSYERVQSNLLLNFHTHRKATNMKRHIVIQRLNLNARSRILYFLMPTPSQCIHSRHFKLSSCKMSLRISAVFNLADNVLK